MRGNHWLRVGLAVLALVALATASACVIRTRPVRVTTSAPAAAVVTAQPVAAGSVGNGTIGYPNQRIRYPLAISYARTVQLYVDGHGLDPTVAVYDGYGNRIGYNDDGGSGLDSRLVLTLAPGNYIVEVSGYGSSTGPFTLTIN